LFTAFLKDQAAGIMVVVYITLARQQDHAGIYSRYSLIHSANFFSSLQLFPAAAGSAAPKKHPIGGKKKNKKILSVPAPKNFI